MMLRSAKKPDGVDQESGWNSNLKSSALFSNQEHHWFEEPSERCIGFTTFCQPVTECDDWWPWGFNICYWQLTMSKDPCSKWRKPASMAVAGLMVIPAYIFCPLIFLLAPILLHLVVGPSPQWLAPNGKWTCLPLQLQNPGPKLKPCESHHDVRSIASATLVEAGFLF